MRDASSGSLVPAMGLAEGTGDTTATQGAGSGEVAVFPTGVLDIRGEDIAVAGTTGEPNVQQRNYRLKQHIINADKRQYTAVIFAPLKTMNSLI